MSYVNAAIVLITLFLIYIFAALINFELTLVQNDTNLIVQSCIALGTIGALIFSYKQNYLSQQAHRLNLTPNISFGFEWGYEKWKHNPEDKNEIIKLALIYNVNLINVGSGTAIIKKISAHYDGKVISTNDPLQFYKGMREVCSVLPYNVLSHRTHYFSEGDSMLSDKCHNYIRVAVEVKDEDIKDVECIKEHLDKIKTDIIYISQDGRRFPLQQS